VVDSNVIVTAHLGPIVEEAAGGRFVMVADPEPRTDAPLIGPIQAELVSVSPTASASTS
jgi:hypothetical protein